MQLAQLFNQGIGKRAVAVRPHLILIGFFVLPRGVEHQRHVGTVVAVEFGLAQQLGFFLGAQAGGGALGVAGAGEAAGFVVLFAEVAAVGVGGVDAAVPVAGVGVPAQHAVADVAGWGDAAHAAVAAGHAAGVAAVEQDGEFGAVAVRVEWQVAVELAEQFVGEVGAFVVPVEVVEHQGFVHAVGFAAAAVDRQLGAVAGVEQYALVAGTGAFHQPFEAFDEVGPGRSGVVQQSDVAGVVAAFLKHAADQVGVVDAALEACARVEVIVDADHQGATFALATAGQERRHFQRSRRHHIAGELRPQAGLAGG
ncbi:hypothetical protein D3C71_954880 [compost metagenome]